MQEIRTGRRSFLSCTLAAAGGALLSGCGEDKELEKVREIDPTEKAKESMDFYKSNVLKKGARK